MKSGLSRMWFIGLAVALIPLASADVTPIMNSTPAKPPRTVQLTEQWRIGGDESDLIFGTVSEVVSDAQGNVYVLDSQLNQVVVFSPEGEHIATLSREGDGPGEIRLPRDVVILDDGSVGIALLFPSKLVRLTPDGEPLASLTMGGEGGPTTGLYVTMGCEARAGTLLMAGQHSVPSDVGQNRTQFLCTVAEDGTAQKRFCESEMVLNFRNPSFAEKELLPSFFIANAVGPEGRVYFPRSRDEYVIEIYHPNGTLERVIEREFDNRQRTARERRRIEAVFNTAVRQIGAEVPTVIEPKNPVIASLFVDNDHRLWVKNCHSGDDQPTGILLTYDVFDAEGRYDQQVSIACEGDPAYDDLKFLPDGRILLIKGLVLARWSAFDFGTVDWGDEEDDVSSMEIVCYSATPDTR